MIPRFLGQVVDLNGYQREAQRTAKKSEDWPQDVLEKEMLVNGCGVAGEAGEVADEIKKWAGHGHPLNREKLKKELGDTLWYVARIAHLLGIPLQDIANANLDKLHARYPEGFSTEASIARIDDPKR